MEFSTLTKQYMEVFQFLILCSFLLKLVMNFPTEYLLLLKNFHFAHIPIIFLCFHNLPCGVDDERYLQGSTFKSFFQ